MHHPLTKAFDYMNSLDPQDQTAVRRWSVRISIVCASFALLLVSAMVIPFADPPRRADQAGISPMIRLVGVSSAMAVEPADLTQCALRDLRIVTSIETHGEAQDVPPAKLAGAFVTLMNARAACAAGRIQEALAIYDGITLASSLGRHGRVTPRCAERDLRASGVIEQLGEIAEMPSAWLAQAGLTWLEARGHCLAGAENEGVALYDRIIAGDARLSAVSTVNERVSR
jgi:hypothetical protein